MGRNCKVIATYMGHRNRYPNNSIETIEVTKDYIEHEKNIDPGVDNLDIIIVNHDCGDKLGNEYLDSLDGIDVYCGKVRVIHRPWGKGIGMSMASYDFIFKKLRDQYDYWFFQEDDYKICLDGYYGDGVEVLSQNEDAGFISYDGPYNHNNMKEDWVTIDFARVVLWLWGFNKYYNKYVWVIRSCGKIAKTGEVPYADGGLGVSTTKILDKVIKYNGSLPHHEGKQPKYYECSLNVRCNKIKRLWYSYKNIPYYLWYWLNFVLSEVAFARIYYDIGLKIIQHPTVDGKIYSYSAGEFKWTKEEYRKNRK